MSRVPAMADNPPYVIENFKGLWIQSETGNARLPVGYSGNMTNFYITKAGYLKKAEGYKRIFESITAPIKKIWNGLIGGEEVTLFVAGGNVYKITFGEPNTHEIIGTIADTDVVNIFSFDDRAYIINGVDYKYYDGTTFDDVINDAYIPTTFVAQTPDRSQSTPLENINLLSGSKRETFIGDGSSTQFYIAEKNVDSIDKVVVDGVEITNYGKDLVSGIVSITPGPQIPSSGDNVEITYTKGNGATDEVLKNKYFCVYGGDNDTRIFLYGNTDRKNVVIYSGLADGVPSATYFPANNFIAIGSNNTAIRDMITVNTRFIIYKEERTYIGYYYFNLDDGIVEYPTSPLTKVNTAPFSQVQVCNGVPYSLGANDIKTLQSTYIRDERNLVGIGERIRNDLESIDLKTSITYDWEERKWYMIFSDKWVWLYDYEMNTYSRLYLSHNITAVTSINGVLYLGTDDGYIMKVSLEERTHDGIIYGCKWVSGFIDFGEPETKKNARYYYVTLLPKNKTQIITKLKASPKSPTTERVLEYNNLDFEDIDFSDFSFATNYDATPERVRIKAKKFSFLQIIFENNTDRDAIILGVRIPITYAGKFK